MHKLRIATVLVAALGSVGLVGLGVAHADGKDDGHGDHVKVLQSSHCKSHDLELELLSQIGIANGLAGNLLNGEGHPGAQHNHVGSTMGCNNSAW